MAQRPMAIVSWRRRNARRRWHRQLGENQHVSSAAYKQKRESGAPAPAANIDKSLAKRLAALLAPAA